MARSFVESARLKLAAAVRRKPSRAFAVAAGFVLLIAIFNGPVIFAGAGDEAAVSDVRLMVGRSTVLDVGKPIARVSLTSSDVADALVTSANQLLINGKTPGTISMFVWDRAGGIQRYEVVVQRDLAQLNEQVKVLFPGESIAAASNGRSIVLSGSVASADVAERAVNVAAGYVEKKEDVVNLLQIRPSDRTNQVLLHVRFAEVTRSALLELGAALFTGSNGYKSVVGRTTTQTYPAPDFDNKQGGLVFTDYLNVFLFDLKHNLGLDIKALQTKGLFQTLAEPNLVAESGKEASFLAGGEFPVPIAQPSGNGAFAITVQYKEFGIRLNFTPVVNGDRVHLKVRPEVSTLDFANAVTLSGFRIPALSTRRAETELELMDQQTFAIAGLLDNTVTNTMQKIPGIGDIPILGELFKSRSNRKDKTELVVMITPEILSKNSPGVTSELPRTPETYLPDLPDKKSHPVPPPAFEKKPSEADMNAASAIKTPAKKAPAPVPAKKNDDASAAASAVSALTPAARPVTNGDTVMASTPTPAPAAVPAARPLTPKEQQALEDARKQELAQQKEEQERMAKLEKKAAKERAEQEKKEKAEQERQAKLAKEQAERDREEARKKAEAEQKQQKAIAEAAAKLKAAQEAYQAEIAKQQAKKDKV
jgi:pilus assembly protein CpaC